MNDLESRLREELFALVSDLPPAIDVNASVRRGQRRLRRRRVAAACCVVAVVGAGAGFVSSIGGGHSAPARISETTPNSRSLGDAGAWRVAAPALPNGSEPGQGPMRACRPGDLTGTAETRTTPGGVVGVIRLRSVDCRLNGAVGPSALLGANGRRLAVVRADSTDPHNRLDTAAWGPLTHGGAWGFAWTGSWCGAAPAFVEVNLDMSPQMLVGQTPAKAVIPLSGPTPSCTGRSASTLTPGVEAPPGQPVLPAPASWRRLRGTLIATPLSPESSHRVGLSLRLTNHSDHPITFAPCPTYLSTTWIHYQNTVGLAGKNRPLPCPATPMVIAARTTASISLDPVQVGGRRATISVAIAGIPTATVTRASRHAAWR
jgi:hypothetical protein